MFYGLAGHQPYRGGFTRDTPPHARWSAIADVSRHQRRRPSPQAGWLADKARMDALVHPCCESLWSIEIHKSYLYLNPSLNLENNLATCQLRISIVRTRLLKKVAPAEPKLSKRGCSSVLGRSKA